MLKSDNEYFGFLASSLRAFSAAQALVLVSHLQLEMNMREQWPKLAAPENAWHGGVVLFGGHSKMQN
jgi:hypothetical protein